MSQWTFVVAAYGLAGLTTTALLGWAYLAMRIAEAGADAVKRRR